MTTKTVYEHLTIGERVQVRWPSPFGTSAAVVLAVLDEARVIIREEGYGALPHDVFTVARTWVYAPGEEWELELAGA